MAISAGNVYSALILDGSKYFSTLEKAEKQMNTFSKKLGKTGKNIEKAGKNLSKYVTAPVVAVGTLSTKAAIDFESAFAGVRKTVDASEKEFAALEKGIRDMSKRMPQSATEISKVAEAAGQLGIKTENILGFTKTMVMLGDATNLSSDQAATALARLANITGMPQTEFSRLGSSVVALGNNLATTESEIVEMGLRLAGTGTQVGLTEDQILALAGAMSSVGINAEAGGSSMSRVMQKMNTEVLSSGKHLQKFAEIAGMSAEEFSKAWRERPQDAILAFVQGLDKINKSGGDVTSTLKDLGINSVQEIDTLLRLAGASDVLTDALGISAKAWEENTALTKEAEQRYQTTASQLQIAKNYLQDAAMTIGEIMVPHLVNFAEKIKNLAEWFKNLNPETQKTIVKFAALVAAIGPVVLGLRKLFTIVGTVSGAIKKMTGVFKLLTIAKMKDKLETAYLIALYAKDAIVKGVSTVATKGMTAATIVWNGVAKVATLVTEGLAVAFQFLTGPIGLVVLAIAGAIAAGIALYKNWDKIKEKAGELGKAISEKWESIKTKTSETWENIQTTISAKWDGIKLNTTETVGNIKSNVEDTWDNIKKKTSDTWNSMKATVERNGGGIKGAVRTMSSVSKSVWSSATSAMDRVTGGKFSSMASKVSGSFSNIRSYIQGGIDKIRAWNRQPVKEKFSSIAEKTSSAFRRIKDSIQGGIDKIRAWNNTKVKNKVATFTQKVRTVGSKLIGRNAKGTNYWRGGLTWIGEQGPELVELPRGSKVYSNQKSMEMAKSASGGITQKIIINSPEPLSPSEIARKNLQVSRQLAMEWGL